jgi:Dolichyl-phosphate-mannose-protein mannosyltransferase
MSGHVRPSVVSGARPEHVEREQVSGRDVVPGLVAAEGSQIGRLPADGAGSLLRRFAVDAAVFACILLLGFARLPAPFTGDQALNMLMGRVIADGGALYIDLWDLKHPGIFLFFAAGGGLFGFTEVGIHLFELLWMLALAVVVRLTAGRYLRNEVAAALAPALTVGFYYAVATNVHLTQTEVIVGLPMLCSLVFAAAAVQRGARGSAAMWFASGVSAGLVTLFKAPYVALPLIFWIVSLVELRRGQSVAWRQAIRWSAPAAIAGLLIPVAAIVVYLFLQNALGVAWWTFVVFPRQAVAETPLDTQLLRDGTVWFVRSFTVPLALAVIGASDRLRRGWDLWTVALVAWVVVGAVLIWAQVIGWWSYHYLLLLVPIGLLAAAGIETLWRVARPGEPILGRVAAVAATLVLIVLMWFPVSRGVRSIADFLRARPLPVTSAAAREFQIEEDPAYSYASRTTSFLWTPRSHPGPIYVFASPILYVLSDRRPAISPLATWFDPTSEAWERMMTELTAASPPYIYLENGAIGSLTAENPAIADDAQEFRLWRDEWYRVLRTDSGGTWYTRRDLPTPPAP